MSGVRITGLSKEYLQNDRRVVAVSNVDLDIRDGEFLCVVGHSGCGKTTLLNILAGFLAPTVGSITFDGGEHMRDGDIGVVFQEYALFPWRTAIGNVEFGLEMRDVPAAERKARAQRYLELVHLGHVAGTYPHQLSGGMRQRVAVARALAYEPSLLLMDEPFGALDAQTRERLQSLTEEIWQKTRKTVFYVTHNLSEAVYLADRIVVMRPHPGRIHEIVPVEIPRPRDALSDAFVALQRRIAELIKDDRKDDREDD
ncbi:MAG: ABC transporter ATP-binding protein [Lautropia sp.]